MHKIHHIHLRSNDPLRVAEWYVQAFGFRITSDVVLPSGERFVRCMTADDFLINISSPTDGEDLADASSGLRFGLEHFAMSSPDVEGDIARLRAMGTVIIAEPVISKTGRRIAFVQGLAGERLELVEVPAA
jgi:catechol 2,3-dioxygenase-like lactoylglutathione lyase family enzyme